jgi:hypothetical protein
MSAATSGTTLTSAPGIAALTRATLVSKRVVKNWLALICAIPIRSLRTKWSRMVNKAVVLLLPIPAEYRLQRVARMSSAISGAMLELSRMSLRSSGLLAFP